MIVEIRGKLIAQCDTCPFQSRYPRKNTRDIPNEWGGSETHLRCIHCEQEYQDAWDKEAAVYYIDNLR